ncbi:MAG TPA: glucose-6-phosphate dehydrogenase assembly protein OpcA [Dehalococcoidia bacterium]|nr:glucose-6-phosphate dehydrogenase assembly protein OpcA [Dehalococcoidia bacterium]
MAQDVTALEKITGKEIAVDPAGIEDAFLRIWRETAGDAYDASTVRLRVLNLVAVGSGPAAGDSFDRVMAVVPQRHPCRGILAVADTAASGVEASIGAHCWNAAGTGRHVCSEEVSLRGAPGQARALASAVLALLVPEVPVEIWLIDNVDLDGAVVAELLASADRVLLDSARSANPADAYRAALAVSDERGIAFCDLAWQRLAGWRALIAQLFDRTDAMAELPRLQSIEIVGGDGRPSSDALLLAGWFASRLRLQPADVSARVDGFGATLYDGTRGTRLAVTSDVQRAPLREVRIRTERASFFIQLHEDSGHMHVREEWPDRQTRRTVAMEPIDDAAVILDALDDRDGASVEIDSMRAILALST